MNAENIKAEFSNLEIHMGSFGDNKFKFKCDMTYHDQLLVMDGGKRVATMHARNIGNVHLEKKAIRIAGLNFEIKEGDEISVVSGSIRLELGDDAETWYKELWE
ncbi:MAG: hypothetical protein ACFFE2_07920 [Candidatus Thorarchaeota archaeon]